MSTETHATDAHAAHDSYKPYAVILGILLVLTVITVAVAGIDLGSGNVVVALSIATIKATLVALFFMHLRHDKAVNAIIAVAGFLFLGLFLMFCLTDINSREDLRPGTEKSAPLKPASGAPAPGGEAGPPAAAAPHVQ